MDNIDRVNQQQAMQGLQKRDVLAGMDIMREYGSIKNGTSKLTDRIQKLIVTRYKEGR